MEPSFSPNNEEHSKYYWRYRNNSYSSKQKTTDKGFFIKPRIKIGKLKDHNIEEITATAFGKDSETFTGTVWSIPISNKNYGIGKRSLSRDISNCYVEINIIQNKTIKYTQNIHLCWLGEEPLPTNCNIAMTPVGNVERREEYATHFPFCYIGQLFQNRTSPINMPRGTNNEALLFFTFPEGNSLYIIPTFAFTEEIIPSLSLDYNSDYEVQLNFRSEEYTHTKRMKLVATSWDSIDLK
jgi:hypothetical protein